jgi:titin
LPASNRLATSYDINTGVARLKINDSKLNDAGLYTVLAENKAGHDHTDGKLDVKKASNIDTSPIVNPNAFAYLNRPEPARNRVEKEEIIPPKVVVPLANVKVNEAKPIYLACKIIGKPKPVVS